MTRRVCIQAAGTRALVFGCTDLDCQLHHGRKSDSDADLTLALIEINAIFVVDGHLIDKTNY